MILTCIVISVPFAFSGIVVCLALTRFPDRVNRLYAADLVVVLVAGFAIGNGVRPKVVHSCGSCGPRTPRSRSTSTSGGTRSPE